MTDPVSLVSATNAPKAPIVHLPNPAPESGVTLSSAADAALGKIGQMQADFEQAMNSLEDGPGAITGPDATKPDASGEKASPLAQAIEDFGQSMETTIVVQKQLTQFVAASSISSSLGRNLNTFLRGQ